MQANKADAIFAVGTIGSNGFVDGGTAYATTRGIIRGVPVYIFDQKDNTWKVWNKEQNKFVVTSQPKLTPKAATIGTRQLQQNGKNAIISILKDTKQNTEYKKPNVVPKAKGRMTFSYGNNKRSDVKANTTLEAIKNGERTATTRYESDGHINYWKNLKVGDIVEFTGNNGESVLVRVTKPLTKLSENTDAETWSKKEGWSVDYFNSKVKPKLNEAWQIFTNKGINTEFLINLEGTNIGYTGDAYEDILNILAVHPLQEDSLLELLKKDNADFSIVQFLLKKELIKSLEYNGKIFYLHNYKKRY